MSALLLDYAVQPNPPQRPSWRSDEVCNAAAALVLPEALRWQGKDLHSEVGRYILHDLEQTYKHCANVYDGYTLASHLDHHHYWEVDSELVDILGGDHCQRAYQTIINKWVETNKIEPSLKLFDRVRIRHRGTLGVINRILPKTAEYGVHYRGESLYMYHIYPYEEVEKLF